MHAGSGGRVDSQAPQIHAGALKSVEVSVDGQEHPRSARNKSSAASLYNLTMDPYEKYDMTFNGAMSYRLASSSPGKYAGQTTVGFCRSFPALIDFDKSLSNIRTSAASPAEPRPTCGPICRIRRTQCRRWIPSSRHALVAAAVKSQRKEGAVLVAGSPFNSRPQDCAEWNSPHDRASR